MTPFDLDDADSYRRWRAEKLAQYPTSAAELVVPAADQAAIRGLCRRANMAIYEGGGDWGAAAALAFANGLGLRHLDSPPRAGGAHGNGNGNGVSEIRVVEGDRYIPYTNAALRWHSDGYYNERHHPVRGVLLHCARAAPSGGGSALLDPEIAYIRLRDEDPAMIAALMHAEALTIPANETAGPEARPARTGPVFSVIGGRLHMRYTARTRNAVWRDDAATAQARAFLLCLMNDGDPLIIRHRLTAGQGLVSNNVLHDRAPFEDDHKADAKRLMYRARFRDRVSE